MKKYVIVICLIAEMAVLLSGCFFHSVEELYAVPEAPKDYKNLQTKIQQVLDSGAEYAAPLTGNKIQSVQLQDLDGDGVKEAIAFFRMTGKERPLQIYIFRQVNEDYEISAIIEGAGTAINSVQYENLDDSPELEIIVSWQMSDKLHSLAAYALESLDGQDQVVEILPRTDYADFKVYDLDRDNQNEILVLQMDVESGGRADLYNYDAGAMVLESSAPMSSGVSGIVENGVKTGYLKDFIPAVFVLSNIPTYGDNGRITDIFAWHEGAIDNITRNEQTGESGETIRFYTSVGATDINGDSITELPLPVTIKEYKGTGAAANFWMIHWRQFDVYGAATTVFSTYYNDKDRWYFILPEDWIGKITLRRNDVTGGGERGVIFSYWEGNDAVEPVDFLTIYRLTGSNSKMRANLPGRFRLMAENGKDTVIYAAEFMESSWDCGLDEEGLRDRFRLIQTDWTA